jgi:hypothetical protein
MDTRSVAMRAGADGLSPAPYVKDILSQNFLSLPSNVGTRSTFFSQSMSRALLHESVLYLLRAMSQMVSYEAVYTKHQFSWALVTLYYSNYFSALSMNRLAGRAISTTNGRSYDITADTIQSNFFIERITANNHISVWSTNYSLYASFNWQDSSYDGTLIKVNIGSQDHYERKSREFINYHPDSYKELLQSKSRENLISFFGKYYNSSPSTVMLLPFTNDMEKVVANLECRAVGRQVIVLRILREVFNILQPTSKKIVSQYFSGFSKNIMSRPPFNSKLKIVFQELIKDFLY